METKSMSISEKNAETVRRGYAAFNTADMKTLTEIFDENCVWHTPGKSSIAGEYTSREKTFAQFGRYGSETHGTFRAELKSIAIAEDGRIIGMHHNTGTRNGKQLDVDCCLVFEFKDGKAISGKEFFFDLNAWDAFWS